MCDVQPAFPTHPASAPITGTPNALQAAMTLAGIAYAPPQDLNLYLGSSNWYALQWTLAAGPWVSSDNTMYAAWNETLNAYAVVIRGANPCDLVEVFDVGKQTKWDYPVSTSNPASISNGAAKGLHDLITMKSQGQTLTEWLTGTVIPASPTPTLWVTGHSLGGGLSSVLAPYLSWWLGRQKADVPMQVYTFAAPTAGDQNFATLSAGVGSVNTRAVNPLDVVPFAFTPQMPDVETLYGTDYPCPSVVSKLIGDALKDIGSYVYVQPGVADVLPGSSVYPQSSYVTELLYQHHHNTYLTLLGAQPLPF